MFLQEIKDMIKLHKQELESNFKVKSIGVFGSYVRNEQKQGSDIDVLVEFKDRIDFFDFLDLEEYLTTLFGQKVDLVPKNGLKKYIGQVILNEVQYV